MPEFYLADLLELTKDGEWGQSIALDDTEPMLVIRGTDFADVRAGDMSSLPVRHIPKRIADRKFLLAGDILIETAGGTKDQPTGRTLLIKERALAHTPLRATCASFSRFLRVKRNVVRPDFLFWHLQNLYTCGELYPFHVQHTGVARFQYTQFASSLKMSIPSFCVQGAIAEVLNALDDKIELNRRMNETLEAMARAIFKDWFVDFGPTRAKAEGRPPYLAPDLWSLFPDRLDDQGKPEEWKRLRLDQLAEHCKTSISPLSEPFKLFEHYSLPAFDNGQEPAADMGASIMSNKTLVQEGAVLLSKLNPEISRVWIPSIPGDAPQVASTEFLIFCPIDPAGRGLLYCLFRDAAFKQMLEGTVTGTSKSHQRISPPALLRTEVLCGAPSVFQKFEATVAPILKHLLNNRTESRTLTQTRDLLLPKLMSGEIRVCDAEALAAAE